MDRRELLPALGCLGWWGSQRVEVLWCRSAQAGSVGCFPLHPLSKDSTICVNQRRGLASRKREGGRRPVSRVGWFPFGWEPQTSGSNG